MISHRVHSLQPAGLHIPRRPGQGRPCAARCQPDDKAKGGPTEINEDVLSKLRAFEEENKKLKDQLAAAVRQDLWLLCLLCAWSINMRYATPTVGSVAVG